MHMPREVVVSGQTPARLDLSLPRRGRIGVTVLDPLDDAALEGVNVVLLPHEGDAPFELSTGPEGICNFLDVKSGIYRARIEAPAGYRARTEEQVIALAPGEALELEFELERSGVVRGRVVDQDTQEPLVGVTVRLFNSTGTFVREVKSVADGAYEFTNLPEDRYEVEVEH
jgi:uncharacterized surface anchored protein